MISKTLNLTMSAKIQWSYQQVSLILLPFAEIEPSFKTHFQSYSHFLLRKCRLKYYLSATGSHILGKRLLRLLLCQSLRGDDKAEHGSVLTDDNTNSKLICVSWRCHNMWLLDSICWWTIDGLTTLVGRFLTWAVSGCAVVHQLHKDV